MDTCVPSIVLQIYDKLVIRKVQAYYGGMIMKRAIKFLVILTMAITLSFSMGRVISESQMSGASYMCEIERSIIV